MYTMCSWLHVDMVLQPEHTKQPRENNQDWFDENDEEIKEILAEKNRLHRIYQLDQSAAAKKIAFTNIRRTVQTRLRGSLPKQMQFRNTLTLTTQNDVSMMP